LRLKHKRSCPIKGELQREEESNMSGFIIPSEKKKGFYKMPDAGGHYFGRLQVGRLWGQISLILFLTRLSTKWAIMEPSHPFGLGDLAHEDGRPMPDHVSHHTGVGADIFVIRKDGLQRNDRRNLTTWADKEYDRERTTKLARLISELRSDFPMIQFLYNDEEVRKVVPGIQKVTGHDEHMHVLLTGKHPYTQEQIEANLRICYSYDTTT
jgi:murein endopeptidase